MIRSVPIGGERRAWVVPALATAAAAAVVVLVSWTAVQQRDLAPGYLTRDPVSVLGGEWYAGALSTLGVILWAGSVGSALLASVVARRDRLAIAGFLGSVGVLSALLMLDDAFLFHEELAPTDLDVPQRFVYLFYAVLFTAWILTYRATLRKTEWQLLAGAAVCFATSFLVDGWESVDTSLLEDSATYLAEDGFKFVGIALWALYTARLAHRSLTRAMPRTASPPGEPS